ncbi:MAG: hypothetical protein ACOC35_07870 [Promethearchaeia archaeon]
MLILDNCVLSAFTRLKLLSSLQILIPTAIISEKIVNEYSLKWQKKIPSWIKIIQSDEEIILKKIPSSLSPTDLTLIRLALEYKNPIASDDRPLREYAEKLGIQITGSLGLLKLLYKKKIIKTREEYMSHLNSLQKDVYISDELMDWALKE